MLRSRAKNVTVDGVTERIIVFQCLNRCGDRRLALDAKGIGHQLIGPVGKAGTCLIVSAWTVARATEPQVRGSPSRKGANKC